MTATDHYIDGMDPPAQDHRGSSPFARYKAAVHTGIEANLGSLSITIPPSLYITLVQWAESTATWREDLLNALSDRIGKRS